MRSPSKLHPFLAILPAATLVCAVFLAALVQPRTAWSDDRDLLGAAGDKPYVFFIIDISSSMKRMTDGQCSLGTNDSPHSRIYQAKKAIFEVLQQAGESAIYGFATYDGNAYEFHEKHWLYTLESPPSWITDPTSPLHDPDWATRTGPPWDGPGTPAVVYPRPGHIIQFGADDGDGYHHDDDDPGRIDNDHTDGSCAVPEDLDIDCRASECTPGEDCCGESKSNWTDTEALGRLWTFGKLGQRGTVTTRQWFKYKGEKYRLTWFPLGVGKKLGDTSLRVRVLLERMTNADCGSPTFETLSKNSGGSPGDEFLDLVPAFQQDLDGDPLLGPSSVLGESDADDCFFDTDDYDEDGACLSSGGNWWNDNNDNIGLPWSYDKSIDPLGRDTGQAFTGVRRPDTTFDRGDMLPWDWTNPGWTTGARTEIMRRLAPSIILGEPPEFRIAPYFKDNDGITGGFLPLKDAFVNQPPIVSSGGTPVAGTIYQFREWFDRWIVFANGLATDGGGTPIPGDPNLQCHDFNLIVLTDGGESCDDYAGVPGFCDGATVSCPNDGEAQSEILLTGTFPTGHPLAGLEREVRTWVIGFAFSGSRLNNIAENGGTCTDRDGDGTIDNSTECAYFPATKDELVDALLDIFKTINSQPRTFVPAASPPSSINADDKIVLTNFVPVAGESTWDGHVAAFIRPLPIDADGKPDTSQLCGGGVTDGCFLWDAGEVLEGQAPTAAEVATDPPVLKIGGTNSQRRVWYGQAPTDPDALPRPRRLFDVPTSAADWDDLVLGMGLDPATERDRAKDVLRETLRIKEATIPDPDTGTPVDIQYVLGDIFHSDPVVVEAPGNARFFALDLRGDGTDCSAGNPGYRCFFDKHRFRRQVLVAGSNDGQAHAFDLARFEGDPDTGSFVNGTGSEIFAHIPRAMLPSIRSQAESNEHDWGVDGSIRVSDVFIDPVHTGTPTDSEREWRTVGVGGLRRGGQAYYALDLTQPDKLDIDNVPQPVSVFVPSCWNEGGTAACGPVAYATELWQFTDTWDEDNSGLADLGNTWSIPNTGILRVDVAGTVEERFVAVVGGGLDPQKLGLAGDWLYIIDIETGTTIYKRQLSSSAASEPAAVDTNQDGFLDTIYIGTIDGFLYKVDISQPQALVDTTVDDFSTADPITGVPPLTRDVTRVTSAVWDPFIIFDTGGRPIYYPPSVIFVAKLGRYSLAFGTGDREDMWATTNQVSRFYNFVDDNFTPADIVSGRIPLTEADLQPIDADVAVTANTSQDFLVNPDAGKERGWVLILDVEERVVTKAFALSGIVTFSSFNPTLAPGGCGGAGTGRIYILNATNANSVLTEGGSDQRYFEVGDFVTNPFTELSEAPDADSAGDQPCSGKEALTQTLMGLFPQSCKFANLTLNIMTIRSDTGLQCIAPVPICIDQKNWKEF